MASDPGYFCFPFTQNCKLMSEWGVYWQAIGVVMAVVAGIFGLYKIHHELARMNEQRAKDIHDKETSAKLKRTEFFLNQHRRLFDTKELYEVLCLIDGDVALLKNGMVDKKRRFLAFLEEIALLVESENINAEAAYYMFGYYALCVKKNDDFWAKDLDPSPKHWRLFYEFCAKVETFQKNNPDGPEKQRL